MNNEELKRLQNLPLDDKVVLSLQRISEFYEKMSGKVYVSFSGGKDSTVLLNLVRSIYPDMKAVFSDTGLEYPEIRDFVKTVPDVTWIRPEKTFLQVIEKHGYPIVSKEQAMYIREWRTTKSEYLKKVRWEGKKGGSFKISDKWKFLVNAPFNISERCCDELKKKPFRKYEKQSGLKSYQGIMAADSRLRKTQYLRYGCNVFNEGKEKSTPIAFWKEEDVWQYIKNNNIPCCNIYDKGVSRTGCMFCLFGINRTIEERLNFLKRYHPQLFNYCMNKLGLKDVIDYMNQHLSKKINITKDTQLEVVA